MKSETIRSISIILLLLLCLWGFLKPAAAGTSVDHAIYAVLLRQYVKDGRVDYGGFKSNEIKLDSYLNVLEKTDTDRLSTDEQFAFYINAYNAWTVQLILTGYPGIESIKDLGSIFQSPWKKKISGL